MAKPLPTTNSLRNGADISRLLRSPLEDTPKGGTTATAQDVPESPMSTWETRPTVEPARLRVSDTIPVLPRAPIERVTSQESTDEDEKQGNGLLQQQLETVRAENKRLREKINELEGIVEEIDRTHEIELTKSAMQLEAKLTEQEELIEKLQSQPGQGGGAPEQRKQNHEAELLALGEELERERKQLKEDESSLMQQMREMELQMSRERAEIARQKAEISRLQNELRHELDMAARDAALRERLAPLQRRQQEMVGQRSGVHSIVKNQDEKGESPSGVLRRAQQEEPQQSGILKRFFGKNP